MTILLTAYVPWAGGDNGPFCVSRPESPCPYVTSTAACGYAFPLDSVVEILNPPAGAPTWLTCNSRGGGPNVWADVALGPALKPTANEVLELLNWADNIGRSYQQVRIYAPAGIVWTAPPPPAPVRPAPPPVPARPSLTPFEQRQADRMDSLGLGMGIARRGSQEAPKYVTA